MAAHPDMTRRAFKPHPYQTPAIEFMAETPRCALWSPMGSGKSVIYHLKLSVLEDALLGFVHSFGAGSPAPKSKKEPSR